MKIRAILGCYLTLTLLVACKPTLTTPTGIPTQAMDVESSPTSLATPTVIPSHTPKQTATRTATVTTMPTATYTPKPTSFNSSLSFFIERLDPITGEVGINGADGRRPTTPFSIDWGDGSGEENFFPLAHTYSDLTHNYVLQITAHYLEGGTAFQDSRTLDIQFVLPSATATKTIPTATLTETITLTPTPQNAIMFPGQFIYQVGAISPLGEIRIANLDGSADQKLVDGGLSEVYPPDVHVSPDGSQFVYMDRGLVTVYNFDTRSNTTIPWGSSNTAPRWSPDSRYLFSTYQGMIYAAEPGGGMIEWPGPQDCETLYYLGLALHPDGRRLTATCKPRATEDRSALFEAALPPDFLHQAVELSYTPLVNPFAQRSISNLQWSPDGKSVALLAYDENYLAELVVYNPNTGLAVGLAGGVDISVFSAFAWSPDSSKIAYFWSAAEGSSLIVANSDGSGQISLTGEFRDVFPYCPPSWSTDSDALLFSTWETIYRVNTDGSGVLRLTEMKTNTICPAFRR